MPTPKAKQTPKSEVRPPPELAQALHANSKAKARWDALAPSHKREYATWIESAKREDTKARRLTQAIEKLVSGQKTPMRADDAPAISVAPLRKKLGLKLGHRFCVLEAPPSYSGPEGGSTRADVVLAFVENRSVLEKVFPRAMKAVDEGGSLWLAFPKKTSGITTDLSRDDGWSLIERAGWQTSGLIAVDEAWSAFRFRRRA